MHPVESAARSLREWGLVGNAVVGISDEALIALIYLAIGAAALAIVVGLPIALVLMERKVSAYFQDRLGPMRVGPWGTLVTIADTIKLLFKEDIVPPDSDRILFRFAPYLTLGASFAVVSVVPVFSSNLIGNLDLGLFLYMALSSLVVLGILMAGWSSNSKYSLLGAMRAAAQIVSYEIPLALSVLMIVMTTGTMNLQDITLDQAGGIHRWHAFRHPFLFVGAALYFVSAVAEVNRTPFDLAEAESEIVAGFHTEYSGIRFAYFFMAEYANMAVVAAICATLFLGGWTSPIPGSTFAPGPFWLIVKGFVLIFTMMWIRWTLPRVRVDQLMAVCWKHFLPILLVCVVGTGVLILFERIDSLSRGLSANAVAWVAAPIVLALVGWYAMSDDTRQRPVGEE